MSLKPIEAAFAIATAFVPCQPLEAGEMEPHAPLPVSPAKKSKGSLCAGSASEITEGRCRIISDGSLSIGIYRIEGAFHAIRNQCPHQGAPLCQGLVGNTHAPRGVSVYEPTLEGRVVRCPWHGWEFDILTGKGLYDLKSRVKTYKTRMDAEGQLWVDL